MNQRQGHVIVWLAILLAPGPGVFAQQTLPRIGYVYPAGGRIGTTFLTTLGGQFLSGATNGQVVFSGTGIQATVLDYLRPLTQKEANDLREKLKELQDRRAATQVNPNGSGVANGTNAIWTAADQRMLFEIRQKLAAFQRKPLNPAIAETVTLRVRIATNAEPGAREVRLQTQLGLTAPLVFCVGELPEFRKLEPKLNAQSATLRPQRNPSEAKATPPTERSITLPAVVNGQILPGGVDWYRFSARKGQRLVVAVSARALIPYLPDAVPGWFQAAVALYDAQGNELAFADHFRFHPDPVLFLEIPKDGEYLVQIRDSIYRGREDFVYRVTIGELPVVTGIFPLGGPAGAQTVVELNGWNLPVNSLLQTNGEPGIRPLSLGGETWIPNQLPFAVDTLPECLEKEPNDSPATAQPVALPVIINGRIDPPGDWDVFRFEGRAGTEIVAEVCARRLDSPLDSVLKLTDAAGKQLAFNDDAEDKGAGLETHHADSYLRVTLPADGSYFFHLGDAQHQGGPEFAYRLRLSAPRPDFALRVVPSSLTVRGGASVPLTIYALRKDGFTNEIAIALVAAPTGFRLSGGKVPANQDQVKLTVTAPPSPAPSPARLDLVGRARIDGVETVRPAVPAEDMMQAFVYRHLVPAKELAVAVSGRFMSRAELNILSATPVKIPLGGTARVRFAAPGPDFLARVRLELSDPPDGLVLQKVSAVDAGVELLLRSDAAKTKAGLKGNLVIRMLPAQNQVKAPTSANPSNRGSLGTLPAVPFEIVESAMAERQTASAQPPLKSE